MGSSIDDNDRRSTNCIKQSSYDQFEQYDENEIIIYSYRQQKGISCKKAFSVYNMNENEIGSFERISTACNCGFYRFNFYDERKELKFYIEVNNNCCNTETFTFFGLDKNIERTIKFKTDYCGITIEEYDKYGSKINTAIEENECCSCSGSTYIENDPEGNPIFIIKKISDCGRDTMKIYDYNRMEVNLNDKNIFNEGFTKIQMILILRMFYDDQEGGSTTAGGD